MIDAKGSADETASSRTLLLTWSATPILALSRARGTCPRMDSALSGGSCRYASNKASQSVFMGISPKFYTSEQPRLVAALRRIACEQPLTESDTLYRHRVQRHT